MCCTGERSAIATNNYVGEGSSPWCSEFELARVISFDSFKPVAGLGVAVIPDWLIREDLLSGRLVRVLPQKDLPVHVIYLGARLLPTRVRAFIDFAVSYLTKEFGSNA
jgi:LysR substrate binding domain